MSDSPNILQLIAAPLAQALLDAYLDARRSFRPVKDPPRCGRKRRDVLDDE